jgi:hypothetical protein
VCENEYERILDKAAMTLLEVHSGWLPEGSDKSPRKTQTISYLVSRSMINCFFLGAGSSTLHVRGKSTS